MFKSIYEMWTPMHTLAFCIYGLKFTGYAMVLYAIYRAFNPITANSLNVNPWWKVWWQKTFSPSFTPEGLKWAEKENEKIFAQIEADERNKIPCQLTPTICSSNFEDEPEEVPSDVIDLEDIGGNIFVVPPDHKTL